LHMWNRIEELPSAESIRASGSAALCGLPVPSLCISMDVNSLNFCRFSLLRFPSGERVNGKALLALPNLVESSQVSFIRDACEFGHS
jgi:hypothetical protein